MRRSYERLSDLPLALRSRGSLEPLRIYRMNSTLNHPENLAQLDGNHELNRKQLQAIDTRELEQRRQIRSIPCWSRDIELNSLPGGITNRNYLVKQAQDHFVARVGKELPHLGIDRRNELDCHRAAELLGIAPPIYYGQNGILVTQYVPGCTLDSFLARGPGFTARIAQTLRQLHDGWDRLSGDFLYFSPFQACRNYVKTAHETGAELPADIQRSMKALSTLSRRISPYTPTLCHNDMLPANVLDDGKRIWIVDWEYAGIGHPLFDLATFSICCEYTPELDQELLRHYFGVVHITQLFEIQVFKAASLLREALWAVVQTVASDLVFDYHAYARRSFEKFELALTQLEITP